MKKALLVATVQSHIAQFHRPLIKILKEEGYEIHIAARDNLDEKNGLRIKNVDKIINVEFRRSPFDKTNISAYKHLKKIIDTGEYDIISCNTPVGGMLTRLAARKARKKGSKVYYMAHGFHFYSGAPKKNWIIYYPIEKIMSKYTDVLITITKEDFILAKSKKFKTDVQYIHGVGVDEQKYLSIDKEENEAFRKKNNWQDRYIILCTGELNSNKNQNTVIEAINLIRNKHPEVKLLLAGNGPEESNLKTLIEELHLNDNVELLGYRTDLEKYTNVCDMVVSASYREGLPLNIMEAMICNKPVIASNNRGHRELIEDGRTGRIILPKDIEGFSKAIEMYIDNKDMCKEQVKLANEYIQKFTSSSVEAELKKLYIKQ